MKSASRWWLGALALGAFVGAYALVQSRDMEATGSIAAQIVAQATGGAATSAVVPAETFGTWPDDARLRFSNWHSPQANLRMLASDVVAAGGEMYALGEYGAIYRSSDFGNQWTLVGAVRQNRRDDPLPMKQLAVLPAQTGKPAVYFAVDSLSTATLYRVSEGRSTIIPLGNPARPWEASPYAVVTWGETVLVAHTDGVSRSDDRGATWQQVLDTNQLRCSDIVAQGRYAYATCNGIYRSVDGGPFQLLDNSNLDYTELAVAPSNPAVVYAARVGAVFRSRDAGATWTRTVDITETSDPMLLALDSELEYVCGGDAPTGESANVSLEVDPQNPDVLWWGQRQLFRSDDGGQTFGRASIRAGAGPDDRVIPVPIRGLAFGPAGSGAAARLFVASGGSVRSTDNAGVAVQAGGPSTCTNLDQPPAVTFAARSQGMNDVVFRELEVAGDGGVLATTARQLGIQLSYLDDPGGWSAIPFSTNASTPHRIFVNPTGGLDRFYTDWCLLHEACRWDFDATSSAWIPSVPPRMVSNSALSAVAFDPQQPGRTWTSMGGLARSEDGLQTSVYVGFSSLSQIAVSPADSNLVLATYICSILRRTDALSLTGEAQWPEQRLRNGMCNVNALEFDARRPNNVYVAVDSAPSVYASTNAGATWAAIDAPGTQDGLPDASTRSLVTDPEADDLLYLGTSEGLFVSWDTGMTARTWHEVPTPFPGMSIGKIVVRKTGPGLRRIHVYTHGLGLWIADVQVSAFSDVAVGAWSADYVQSLYTAGITTGCGLQRYCPTDAVLREQMAVFLLRAAHGGTYAPPVATGMFADVDSASPYRPWIEQLAREGITSGCGAGYYCPGEQVSRGQMAVFLLRAKHGSTYQPPPATGRFEDVAVDSPMGPWIEQLAQEGITGGCSATPAKYCPDDPVTREQMAVFLVKTFGL